MNALAKVWSLFPKLGDLVAVERKLDVLLTLITHLIRRIPMGNSISDDALKALQDEAAQTGLAEDTASALIAQLEAATQSTDVSAAVMSIVDNLKAKRAALAAASTPATSTGATGAAPSAPEASGATAAAPSDPSTPAQ